MNLQNNKQSGFTIVELLIVIVVIAILAAISIVTFSGIQNRARTSSGQQLANQVEKKAVAFNAINSSYPGSFEAFGSEEDSKLEGITSANLKTDGTIDGDTSSGGKNVSYVPCGVTGSDAAARATGAKIAYWDFAKGTPAAVEKTLGTGC